MKIISFSLFAFHLALPLAMFSAFSIVLISLCCNCFFTIFSRFFSALLHFLPSPSIAATLIFHPFASSHADVTAEPDLFSISSSVVLIPGVRRCIPPLLIFLGYYHYIYGKILENKLIPQSKIKSHRKRTKQPQLTFKISCCG